MDIGNDEACNNAIPGRLDDVRIYNRALTQSEITRLYRIGATLHVNTQINNNSLSNGLVGWWTFDGKDMSNNTALDRAGNNNGVLSDLGTGLPVRVLGKLGQALKFDGVDDYVNMGAGSATAYDFTDNFSIAAWVNILSYPIHIDQGIIAKFDGSDHGYGIHLHNFGGNWVILFASADTADANSFNNIQSIALNTWYHIAAVRKGGTNILFINGLQQSQTGTNAVVSNSSNLVFGRIYADFIDFNTNMILDDVRVWNRALSLDEIKRLYQIGGGR